MVVYKSAMSELTLKYTPSQYRKVKIASSRDIYEMLGEMYNADTMEYREEMIVVYLNGANNTVGFARHSLGSTGSCTVDQKIILTEALLSGAVSITISHNHPSGQLHPSRQDEKVTAEMKKACEAVGIGFLDHVIVAGDMSGYYSFSDEGKI